MSPHAPVHELDGAVEVGEVRPHLRQVGQVGADLDPGGVGRLVGVALEARGVQAHAVGLRPADRREERRVAAGPLPDPFGEHGRHVVAVGRHAAVDVLVAEPRGVPVLVLEAEEARLVARLAEQDRQGRAGLDVELPAAMDEAHEAVGVRVAAGDDGAAGRRAHGAGREVVEEQAALGSQAVDVRRRHGRAVAAEVVAEVVARDDDDVRLAHAASPDRGTVTALYYKVTIASLPRRKLGLGTPYWIGRPCGRSSKSCSLLARCALAAPSKKKTSPDELGVSS